MVRKGLSWEGTPRPGYCEGAQHVKTQRKSIPGGKDSKYEISEGGTLLARLRKSRKASVLEWTEEKRLVGGGAEESEGPGPGSPVTVARSLDFTCERKLKQRSG